MTHSDIYKRKSGLRFNYLMDRLFGLCVGVWSKIELKGFSIHKLISVFATFYTFIPTC